VAILEAGGYGKADLAGYLGYAKSLGFTHLEFSDGTIFVPDADRAGVIQLCMDTGFAVISEVGKKDPKKDEKITLEQRVELMKADLQCGSQLVIIEARESGKGIGVMGKGGDVDFGELDKIIEAVGLAQTMIEAPDKKQQQGVYMQYGPAANIGNVQPRDIMSVAALRGGLRGDTIRALRREQWSRYHAAVSAPAEYGG